MSVNNGDELVIFDVLFTSAVFLFEKAKKNNVQHTKKIAFEIQRELLNFFSKFLETLLKQPKAFTIQKVIGKYY